MTQKMYDRKQKDRQALVKAMYEFTYKMRMGILSLLDSLERFCVWSTEGCAMPARTLNGAGLCFML